MRKRMRRGLVLAGWLLALAVGVAGCKRDVVHVRSNTFWDGVINNNIHIGGFGDKDYEIHGKLGCVTVQKQRADTLYLRLRINDGPEVQTTEPLGAVVQCR